PKQETYFYYLSQRLSKLCLTFRLRQAQFARLLINLTKLNKIIFADHLPQKSLKSRMRKMLSEVMFKKSLIKIMFQVQNN
ncbi:MAG: hypothetical protein P8Y79_14130, partial [Ignavibacteriaceae bacterium]